jgi:Rrf2 family protein
MGMHGGYFLAKSPDQITFAEVIRVLDGSWAPVFCVDKETPETCPEENHCCVRGVMLEVHEAVDGILSHTTLADACQGQKVAVS